MHLRALIADFIYPEGRERRDQAERAQNTDALTGLGNRRALDLALPAAEADPRTSVVFFDANNFGQVNKLEGDAAGDQMLRHMAASLRQTARRFGCGSRVFRKGGDEFVCLVPTTWAVRFRDRAEREMGVVRVGAVAVSLTGSVGQTLVQADSTLQARKRARKQRLITGPLNRSLFLTPFEERRPKTNEEVNDRVCAGRVDIELDAVRDQDRSGHCLSRVS